MLRYTALGTNSNKFENFVGNNEATYYYHIVMRDYETLFDAFKLVLDKRFCISSDQSVITVKESVPRRQSPAAVARNVMSQSFERFVESAEKDPQARREASNARALLLERMDKRKMESELLSREDAAMKSSIRIDDQILDMSRLLSNPDIDQATRNNYETILDRMKKRQKILDDRLEYIRQKLDSMQDDD